MTIPEIDNKIRTKEIQMQVADSNKLKSLQYEVKVLKLQKEIETIRSIMKQLDSAA